ncbi:MAG: CHAD domain-containing protein [Desulfobulbus oligotrophicus]|jgi:CHAD domain-containing protein|nr:CHAD domain-containing protein [Desulfobulbus oligotrophicus]
MPQHRTDSWQIPDGFLLETLLGALSEAFTCECAPVQTATVVYADSFDWRLYRRGYLLHCQDRCWTLHCRDTGEKTLEQDGPILQENCFARDFPSGRLQGVLESVLSCRCLFPLTSVSVEKRTVCLHTQGETPVARLVLETQQPVGGPKYQLIRLLDVCGDSAAALVRHGLTAAGVHRQVSPHIGFIEGCRLNGRQPLDYSSKFVLALEGHSTARGAMTRIYLKLLESIERNLPGVLADWDREFLHDMRVAIRRTRSGLSLVKKVLPDEVTKRFRMIFRSLGSITGPVRDLDVYLQRQNAYVQRLAPALQPGLLLFFADLADRRRAEHAEMVKRLGAASTRNQLDAWRHTLQSSAAQPPAPSADRPAVEEAGRIICRHFKRVVRDGRFLHAETPDAAVHRLRIQAKKLRYAIEFFHSLYPQQDIEFLLRHLKRLQDVLGDFNDLAVQQKMLRDTRERLPVAGQRHLEQAVALDALMQSLREEQQKLRSHFVAAFARFDDSAVAEVFAALFQENRSMPEYSRSGPEEGIC